MRTVLGADVRDVMRSVLGQGLRVALVEVIIGGIAAIIALRLLACQVYGLDAPGPMILLAALALLTVTALAASALPVRRAMRLDPVKALRCE